MKWFLFIFFLLIPFVLAETLTFNESFNQSEGVNFSINESFVDLNLSNTSLEENVFSFSINESFIDLNDSENFTLLNVSEKSIFVDFIISSFSSGSQYFLDLFEFLLQSSKGEGGEYEADLIFDEQNTPNFVAQGIEYSVNVGGYGYLSQPISVSSSYCGDSTCDSDENCSTCPADCGECAVEEENDIQNITVPNRGGSSNIDESLNQTVIEIRGVSNRSKENKSVNLENESTELSEDKGLVISGNVVSEFFSKSSNYVFIGGVVLGLLLIFFILRFRRIRRLRVKKILRKIKNISK